jgi:hypothetical protein
MNTAQKNKEIRLNIVSDLYKKGYSFRDIAKELKTRLGLEKAPSTGTIFNYVQTLLSEWRESRISDTDLVLQLELSRIDDTVRELWSQWEKSKQDYTRKSETQKGSPKKANNEKDAPDVIKTYQVEKTVQEVVQLGNVAYIAEIRQQLAERRKLLGIYAPEKKELTGKGGKDLMPPTTSVNLSELTEEEKQIVLKIARANDQQT